MSRIVVKNLPNKISEKKLKQIFSTKGVVTDLQLKFNEGGNFRNFAFIGYQTEDQAKEAIEAFNKSFVQACQIEVEPCRTLLDKKVLKRSYNLKEENIDNLAPVPKVKKAKKKIKDDKVAELIKTHKDDTLFKEFMEVHLPEQKELWESKEENNESDGDENLKKKDADKNISDLEYIKKKRIIGDSEETKEPAKPRVLRYTAKLSNLPFKIKKIELKEFFRPIKVASFRIPRKIPNIAYCDFHSEKDRQTALTKDRSFIRNKRIFVTKYTKNNSDVKKEKWKAEEEKMKDSEAVAESGRVFVRNLAYTVLQDELKELFEKYGPVTEVILPVDPLSRKIKGFAFITYLIPEHACKAFNDLDGTVFQGRMLHLLPGRPKTESAEDDDTGLSYKQKKAKEQKAMASNKINWNTFFINENCLTEAMAKTYKTTKENVLSDERGGAAVRLALGETEMVKKTKDFLVQNGVLLEAFENMGDDKRSETVILVKNLPFSTTEDEIREKFHPFGELNLVLLSPYGGTAIVEFIEPSEANKAFKRLAYSRFKHIPLYLEWAPKNIFDGRKKDTEKSNTKQEKGKEGSGKKNVDIEENKNIVEDDKKEDIGEPHIPVEGATLYVKGINFSTNSENLKKHFESCGTIISAIVAEKRDPNNPREKLSMGYGFVEFADTEYADKALKTLQFSVLDGHTIELKRSNRTTTVNSTSKASTAKGKPSTKMVVRNVPFQATEKEIRALFQVFGDIKALRLPKKMVGTGSHRGFCFVEFRTINDAKRAFKALCESTHLYGRRLVLEWAETDDSIDTLRKKVAKTFTSSEKESKKKNVSIDDLQYEADE